MLSQVTFNICTYLRESDMNSTVFPMDAFRFCPTGGGTTN